MSAALSTGKAGARAGRGGAGARGLRIPGGRDGVTVAAFVGVIALMIVPLPPLVLDLLLTVSITVGVLVLLTSVYVGKPLDFSVFPSLLLVTTLFRLGLNVASTRLILLGAADGHANPGRIIETFGHFVVGGNAAVGVIVFLILVIINFMVITKGAGRIAEVTARFTLDALPGKQMSIDAELASGAITDKEAKAARKELGRESEFYGAMDGASKFVRGDAIAGLVITAINIVGGLLIAVTQGGLGFPEAIRTYTVLTVGDGLVSQIPALLISTGAGVLITRAASDTDLGGELGGQLLGRRPVLFGAAGTLLCLGLLPGMPLLVFTGLAGGIIVLGRRLGQAEHGPAKLEENEVSDEEKPQPTPRELLHVDTLTLEIGFGLVSLVDPKSGGSLPSRLVQMRGQIANELGVLVPPIHIRDNLGLPPNDYQLLLKGTPVARGTLAPARLLAIDPGSVSVPVQGRPTKDPTFGLDALWILPEDRYSAEASGYTVVELGAVVTTHIGELLRQHAPELLGWQELQERLDLLAQDAPKLVQELVPGIVGFADLLKVLRALLAEGVSVRDMRTIAEAVGETAGKSSAVGELVDAVRVRLAPQICASLMDGDKRIHAALMDRDLEDHLRRCVLTQANEHVLACDLATAEGLFSELERVLGAFAAKDADPVILAPPDLRGPLQRFLKQFFPNISVICHQEVVRQAQIMSVGHLSVPIPPERSPLLGLSRGSAPAASPNQSLPGPRPEAGVPY